MSRMIDERAVHPLAPRVEMMIARSEALSPWLAQIVGVLLDAARPSHCGGRDVLRPLWTEEAMQRACSMLHLAAQLDQSAEARASDNVNPQSERRFANDLAALYRTLDIERDEEVLPCLFVLQGVVRNLVALFGTGAGWVIIRTDIERVSLPAYKRRALVLAASELVINALRHGFVDKSGGQIDVTLQTFGTAQLRLTVVDNGCGLPDDYATGQSGITAALADLLEGGLVYRRLRTAGTYAEIVLPAHKDLRMTTGNRKRLENCDCAPALGGSAAA
jgi:two-component sensor histidine kinase